MSRENADAVHETFSAAARTGDLPLELYAADMTFTPRGEVGDQQTYKGHAGMREAIATFFEVWESIAPEIVETRTGQDVGRFASTSPCEAAAVLR